MSVLNRAKITDTDLRRALVFYLIGFGMLVQAILVSVGQFVDEFATPPSAPSGSVPETPIVDMTLPWMVILSFFIMVSSQIWYLGVKRIWNETGNKDHLIIRILVGVAATVLLLFIINDMRVRSDPADVFWLCLISSLTYYPVIVLWNVKRIFDKKYPDMNFTPRIISVLLSGSVLMIVLVLAFTSLSHFILRGVLVPSLRWLLNAYTLSVL
jgi:hypothetical protein